MKKFFMFAIAFCMALAASAANLKTEKFNFGEISAIKAGFNYNVEVTYGKTESVTVTYPEDFEKYLDIRCENGKLILSTKALPKRGYRSINGDEFTVKLKMRKINSLDFSGASTLTTDGNFTADNTLRCDFSGAADLNGINISARVLEYEFSGASNGLIKGEFGSVSGNVSGAANLTLKIAKNTERFYADLSGAVEFKAYAENVTGETVIEISGAAEALISGNTDIISLEASGASEINAKDMTANRGTAVASGSSSIRIYGKEHLDLEVSGAADIKYYGTCSESEVVKRLPKYAASIESGN